MRRAAKIDGNHEQVVGVLRSMGCSVQSLAGVGRGVPDLLVGVGGHNILIEVKNGPKGKLTPDQTTWMINWRGTVLVVSSVDECVDTINYIRKGKT